MDGYYLMNIILFLAKRRHFPRGDSVLAPWFIGDYLTLTNHQEETK